MKREDFYKMNKMKLNKENLGKISTIGSLDYEFKVLTNYSWSLSSEKLHEDRKLYTLHPKRNDWMIHLEFKKNISETYDDIIININILSFYTCGPCGFYIEISGNIGDIKIKARAILSGTVRSRDSIDIISIRDYLFYIEYDMNNFSLMIFKEITNANEIEKPPTKKYTLKKRPIHRSWIESFPLPLH